MKKSVMWMSIGIACNCASGIFLCMMLKMNRYPDLQMKFDRITVREGENVDAGMYVKVCISDGGRLILPQIRTEESGKYVVVYSLLQDDMKVDRILFVEVTG